MSGTGFQVFNAAFSAAADFIYAVCLALFVRAFMIEQGHRVQKGIIVFFAYPFISWLCGRLHTPQGTFPLVLILLLTAASKKLGLERPMAFLLGLLYWEAKISGALAVELPTIRVVWLLPYEVT